MATYSLPLAVKSPASLLLLLSSSMALALSLADSGATMRNSAVNLKIVGGLLGLDNGASLVTAGGFANTGSIEIFNDLGSGPATTLTVNATTAGFEDASGYLDSGLEVSGNSQAIFAQGGQISGIAAGGSLSLDGLQATVQLDAAFALRLATPAHGRRATLVRQRSKARSLTREARYNAHLVHMALRSSSTPLCRMLSLSGALPSARTDGDLE